MYLKNLFFLFFFYSLTVFSVNKNIENDNLENDTLLDKNKYKWIITNSNELTHKNEFYKNEIDSIFYMIAKNLENNGYPFSTIEFRYDSIKEKNIYGNIFIQNGSLTRIDSVTIKGYNKFPAYLIRRYLGIRINEKYNQKKIDEISRKLEKNIFLKEYKKNSILFNKEKTILFFYLEKKYNNSIDGFLGINNNQGKTSLNGKINLTLSNALNMWESINIKWNKLTEKSQQLSLNCDFPFFLNSTFLLNTKINILQYENSYISKDLTSSLMIKKENNFFKLGYLHKRSHALNNPSNSLIQDYKKNLIILNWTNKKSISFLNEINYVFSKEYSLGYNKISSEHNIRQQIGLSLKCDFPLFENNFIYLNSNNILLIGENILDNEKIGVGGISQIRGFLENSFFSKSIYILNMENKYFFNTQQTSPNKSYFSVFYDYAKLYDLNTQLESFGLGIGIDMKNDVFLINYAIPKYNKTIQINNSKIHFNYILKF